MSRAPRCKPLIGATLATTAGVVALGLAPSAASAADPTLCDAGALRLSVLGGAPVLPIFADGGAPGGVCVDSDGTVTSLPLATLDVQAAEAHTRVVPATSATATARIAGLRIGAGPQIAGLLGGATGPLLTGPTSIVGQVDGLVTGLLGPLTSGPLAGLVGGVPVLGGIVLSGVNSGALLGPLAGSLTGALTSTLPDVLEAGVIQSVAQTTCSIAGLVQAPTGSAQITDLQALGTTVDPNGAAERITTLDTAKLNLGQLLTVDDVLRSIRVQTTGVLGTVVALAIGTTQTTLYELLRTTNPSVLGALNNLIGALSGGQTLGSILSGVTSTLQPLLNGAEVNLPPNLVRVQLTPRQQADAGGTLSQQAVILSVSALSRPVLSGTLAEARVSTGSVVCVPPVVPPVDPPVDPPVPPVVPPSVPPVVPPRKVTDPAPPTVDDTRYGSPEAAALLRCLRVPAMLIDVFGSGSRTRIYGAAEQRYAGRTATIVLAAGNKRVGRVRIDDTGLFSTVVPLPPRTIRSSNRARYYATVDGRRTSALKFSRRMQLTGLTARGRTVTLTGRVTGPRAARPAPVVIEQRIGCGRFTTVGRATPGRDGRFSVRVAAAEDAAATVYRARTRVPATARSKRLRATFTLPRVVGL